MSEPLTATTTRAGDEREALLPCPFCGSAAKYAHNTFHGDESMAVCVSCGATAFWSKWQARAALATAPEQAGEPVAWLTYDAATGDPLITTACLSELASIPLYTAPPPASTNRLTDEQIVEMARNHSHLFDDGASIWTRDSLVEFARALLRTSSASAQEAEDEPLTCDFCGAQTDDPWHTSDATRKHLHQCDACHVASELTDDQIVQIGHQYFRPDHDPKAVTNFVKAVRACFRASDSAAVRDNEGQS